MTESESLQKTPLYDEHLAAGGRMVPFAGYSLPVQYTSLAEEHTAVRTKAGLFDVSHMGEVFITGSNAFDFVQNLSCNDHSKLAVGRAQYTGLMYPQGTFVDDMLVHRMDDQEFLLVVNAANRHKDVAYLQGLAEGQEGVTVEDRSDQWAQMAIQGPLASEIAQALTSTDLSAIRYYRFAWGEVAGRRALIARTGYTGEDGFEIMVPSSEAPDLWDKLAGVGVKPCGLGARDTLRLEAGMNLYGSDMTEETSPLVSGLGWTIAWKPEDRDFIGRSILEKEKAEGIKQKIVGLVLEERGVLRGHQKVIVTHEGVQLEGEITSGTFSPSLQKSIALARVPVEIGESCEVEIRGKLLKASVVKAVFVRDGQAV